MKELASHFVSFMIEQHTKDKQMYMHSIDTSLIKMLNDHYWIKRDSIVEEKDP